MKILIYNRDTRRFEQYDLDLNEPMPYTTNNNLKVADFHSNSVSSVIWSDKSFLQTFENFRRYYGKPIYVGYCFKRIWEGGHEKQSQHYAGAAFDCGQNLNPTELEQLRQAAIRFGSWSFVEPARTAPTWVHMDKRLLPPACPGGGYISLSQGSSGVYVLILQDALNAIGVAGAGLSGIFDVVTKEAVQRFQQSNRLPANGVVGCSTWQVLTSKAYGVGKTPTVVQP